MADGDSRVVGDDSLVQRQNSLVSSLQPTNLQETNVFSYNTARGIDTVFTASGAA